MKIHRRLLISCTTLALMAAFVRADGQRPSTLVPVPQRKASTKAAPAPAPPSANGPAQMTADDVAAFLDGVVPLQLKHANIAGAVVLVVKDGQVLYAHGYGYSNVKRKTPVTVDATLFRPGSISKLFTWTAVMQLVQQGKIDLDRNINDYLDFKIPDTFPKPITMRNLMTHTPGFEESIMDLIVDNPKDLVPLGKYLKTHMPARVFPAGSTPAYSNYGAALASYIVQRVSGMPYDEYIQKNIFGPLNMQHSTFDQPLPANLKPLMSNGYKLASEKPIPYEIVIPTGAGGLATTADDISHFMLAHLQEGTYNGTSILSPATVAQMHARQEYGENPATNGMCLGFYEASRNGHRIIGHGGDTLAFHSDLLLIQDANVGFFVSYNSAGNGTMDPRSALFNQFLDRYFPYTIPPAHPPATAKADAKKVAGEYIGSRGSFTNMFSFTGVLGQLTVAPKSDGKIVTDAIKTMANEPQQWEEIGPLVYRAVDGQSRIAFQRDYKGALRISVDYPFMVFDRASFINSKGFNLPLLIVVPIVTLLCLIFWPFAAWIRRHYHRPLVLTRTQRAFYIIIHIVCALDVLFFLCWIILAAMATKNLFLINHHIYPALRAIQAVGWLGSLGTILVILGVFDLWKAENRWWLSRLGYVVVTLACISFSWLLYYWHFLHFSVRF